MSNTQKQYHPTYPRWRPHRHHLPTLAHAIELVVAVAILGSGQNFFAAIVRANPDVTPPSVPANLQLTGRSVTEIDLSWTASTDDVGVTGYHVFRSGTLVGSPVSNSFNDTGLTPNTAYAYTVSAYDAAGNESPQSTPPFNQSTLPDTTAPSVPVNVRQTSQTTGSIGIAWDASNDNVGVVSYSVYRNGTLIRTQSNTSYIDTGLAVFTAYNYNVTALDAANNASNLSVTLNGSTARDTTPPSVPDNLQETAHTISSVNLSWNAATDDIGVTGYHVYRNGTLVGSPAGNSFTDSGLSVSSSYTYTVSAFDGGGNNSAQSAPFNATSSDDTTPPSTPTNVRTTTVLDGSMSLAWDVSTDDVGVTGYKIYRDGSLIGTSPNASFTDSGLQPATSYSYNVKAYDAANNTSPASAPLAATTAYDTTPPTVPTNLTSTNTIDSAIALSWTAATDRVGVTGYKIYRDGAYLTSTVATTYTDSNLAVNTAYNYTVSAYDSSHNESAQSSVYAGQTLPDTTAPTTPSGLSSSAQTTTSIALSWSAGSDDVAVAGYRLYRDGTYLVSTGVSGLSYTDSGLHYNQHYNYNVTTIDASGNESPVSAAVGVSTLPDTTAPTVQITAPTNGSNDQFTIPISANASDDLDLSHVDFYIDSTEVASLTSAPFAINYNTYNVHNTQHTVTVKAYDASGNMSSQAMSIAVTNPPPALYGDLNGDHKVNIYDLSILLSHWNKSGAGDFNNNGKVDIFDLSTLLSRFGQDNSNYN